MKESFFLSLRFRIAINLILAAVLPMLAAIWFASFQAINIIRSPAPQNLELKPDVLTQSFSRWEQMNVQVLGSLSQDPSTVSMNASQQLPLLAAVNRSYSDRYLAEADNLEGYVVARGSGTAPDRLNRSDRHWFKNAVGGTEITREAVISPLTGKPTVIFSTPIREFASLSTDKPADKLEKIQGVAIIGQYGSLKTVQSIKPCEKYILRLPRGDVFFGQKSVK